jgi:hypothetical protein
MHGLFRIFAAALVPLLWSCLLHAQTAGAPAGDPLVVVQEGRPVATVIVSAQAGELEKAAAADLVKYVERMTGA